MLLCRKMTTSAPTDFRSLVPGEKLRVRKVLPLKISYVMSWSRGSLRSTPIGPSVEALADARAQGKTILRLNVVLDEGGWTHAPDVSQAPIPVPTADRLQTALNLVQECGFLSVQQNRFRGLPVTRVTRTGRNPK